MQVEKEFDMSVMTKRTLIGMTMVLGVALSTPVSAQVLSDPAPSSNAMQSLAATSLQHGDLVRLRSGGPLMTVGSVRGNQADCFWTGGDGEPNAQSFPIDVLQKF
jgi:uncharacterized protein YodC (DUF2158 family)